MSRAPSKTDLPEARDGLGAYTRDELFRMDLRFVEAMRRAHPEREEGRP
jgi:hypothetical protein